MFGYILPEKPELKVREYELFRAYYCGVCKSIGSRYGQLKRMTLNYDSTFLAILLSCLSDAKLDVHMERCIAHPVKKRLVIKNNDIVDYASDINIILAYHKMKDNWNDEKSIGSRAGMMLLNSAYDKIKNKYKAKCTEIEKRLIELSRLEKNKCAIIDKAAEPFAKLMEEIIVYEPCCSDEKSIKILKWIGYNMGRWIYILDAYDDIEKDISQKSYNPFIYQYSYTGEDIKCFKDKIRNDVEFNLTYSLSQIAKAFELLDKKSDTAIAENIIYMGMLRKTENILKAGSCNKIEKSI